MRNLLPEAPLKINSYSGKVKMWRFLIEQRRLDKENEKWSHFQVWPRVNIMKAAFESSHRGHMTKKPFPRPLTAGNGLGVPGNFQKICSWKYIGVPLEKSWKLCNSSSAGNSHAFRADYTEFFTTGRIFELFPNQLAGNLEPFRNHF